MGFQCTSQTSLKCRRLTHSVSFPSKTDIVEIKHIMLPPSPREFKDIYVVFELMETDLHQVHGGQPWCMLCLTEQLHARTELLNASSAC